MQLLAQHTGNALRLVFEILAGDPTVSGFTHGQGEQPRRSGDVLFLDEPAPSKRLWMIRSFRPRLRSYDSSQGLDATVESTHPIGPGWGGSVSGPDLVLDRTFADSSYCLPIGLCGRRSSKMR